MRGLLLLLFFFLYRTRTFAEAFDVLQRFIGTGGGAWMMIRAIGSGGLSVSVNERALAWNNRVFM